MLLADHPFNLDQIVPNFNPMMLLHGEQYLEIRKYPVPTSAKLINKSHLIEVLDKGNASVVKIGLKTTNAATGEDVFYNEMTAFIRGSGGFDGQKTPSDRGAATAVNRPPSRARDFVAEYAVPIDHAALYRLSGDYK
jgi:multifunctional beta-oxidation protein